MTSCRSPASVWRAPGVDLEVTAFADGPAERLAAVGAVPAALGRRPRSASDPLPGPPPAPGQSAQPVPRHGRAAWRDSIRSPSRAVGSSGTASARSNRSRRRPRSAPPPSRRARSTNTSAPASCRRRPRSPTRPAGRRPPCAGISIFRQVESATSGSSRRSPRDPARPGRSPESRATLRPRRISPRREWPPRPPHGGASWSRWRCVCRPATNATPTPCARRSAGSSCIATAPPSSPARAPTSARGSATARLTSSALLRAGLFDEARAFVEWFAPFQYPSGAVPCCVDRRGADPVPEHDSHGELIFAIAETWRYTRDRAFLERMFPHVERAVAHMDTLRAQRRTPEYASGEKQLFYGLMPESISHEGYSSRPVHSYWDDFFALRGLEDAVELAEAIGDAAKAAAFARSRDEFAADFHASIRRAIAHHRIDFIPGSADLGDFDATSTTIALAPGGEQERLPPKALERTFERYWEEFVARRDGKKDVGRLHALRAAQRRRLRAPGLARAGPRAPRVVHGPPPAGGVERMGRGRRPRPARAALHRRHAARLGGLGLHPLVPRPLRLRARVGPGDRGRRRDPRGMARQRRVRPARPAHALRSAGPCLQQARRGDHRAHRGRLAGSPRRLRACDLPGRYAAATINGRRATPQPDGTLLVREIPATIELR